MYAHIIVANGSCDCNVVHLTLHNQEDNTCTKKLNDSTNLVIAVLLSMDWVRLISHVCLLPMVFLSDFTVRHGR